MSKSKTTTTIRDYSSETWYYTDSGSRSWDGDTRASSARGPGRTMWKGMTAVGGRLNRVMRHPQKPYSSGTMTQRTRGIGPQTRSPGHTEITVPHTQRQGRSSASRGLSSNNNLPTNGLNAQPLGLPPGMTPTIVNAQDINFQHDAEYQMVPVPTVAFQQSTTGTTPVVMAPILIMPSLTRSMSSSSSRLNKPKGRPAYNSSRGRKPDPEDPEVLLKSANHRFHAWFRIPDFIQSQKHNPVQGSKISPILEKMKFAVDPFHVTLKRGRVWIHRERDDELFNDLIGFVDAMDSLLGDFISLYPDFILRLPKRLRKDMLWMYDTPSNKEWIQMVRDATSKGRHSTP